MQTFRPPCLRSFSEASIIEYVQTDGVGGVAASSILGANTRKQHALLAVPDGSRGRVVLVANLQETVVDQTRSYDLSTNAYFGAIHPKGYEGLDSFTSAPWPTWTYRFDPSLRFGGTDDAFIEKQVVMVHGEHTVVVVYRLVGGERPVTLTVRPLLAFRDHNCVCLERDRIAGNWQATTEFIECCPFEDGPTLFIAHPNAKVETVGMWYRGFIYHRDQEAHLDCIEDLYHPGSIEIGLVPNISRCLIFSTPSPRPVELAGGYLKDERARRQEVVRPAQGRQDAFFEQLLESASAFVYERFEGTPGVHPGLPWGECEIYRGLLAFPGLFLVPSHFDAARKYFDRLAGLWCETQRPVLFAPGNETGQMHPADVPLWLFLAAWRYWKCSSDDDYTCSVLLPLLQEIADCYCDNVDVHLTDTMLVEVGHEPGASYSPILPLGTNALWFNAQMILSEMMRKTDRARAAEWHRRGQEMVESLRRTFACERRPGLADGVRIEPFWRDETLRASQILAVGLPYAVASEPASIIRLVDEHLVTPYGLRTLAAADNRYVGNGMDVKVLPKSWSGSIDATWLGCYCDALKKIGRTAATAALFEPFERESERRGLGHISGAFAGDSPYEPCDYVASASATGELLRIYARDMMRFAHLQ